MLTETCMKLKLVYHRFWEESKSCHMSRYNKLAAHFHYAFDKVFFKSELELWDCTGQRSYGPRRHIEYKYIFCNIHS